MTLGTISLILIGVSGAINAAEYYCVRREMTRDGLLSYTIANLQYVSNPKALLTMVKNILFGYSFAISMVFAELACSAILVVVACAQAKYLFFPLCLVLLFTVVYNLLRCPYGTDGSDQMLVIILTVFTIITGLGETHAAARGAACMACVQLALSYWVAGAAKLFGRLWRNGTALSGIVSTAAYGRPSLSKILLENRRLATSMCWAVILFELSFPAIWICPVTVFSFLLLAGVAFHLGIAVVMGLNTFMVTFWALYPLAVACRWGIPLF
jgi:hypothetical protein